MRTTLLPFFTLFTSLAWSQQTVQPINWWSPPVLSQLPDIDSIAAPHRIRRTLFDFEHTLSLYRWGTSIYATSAPILAEPLLSIAAEGRSRLRQDTRVRTTEAGASLRAGYQIEPQTTSALVAFSATSYAQDQKATTSVANIAKLSSVNDGTAAFGVRQSFGNYVHTELFGGFTVKAVEERKSSGPMVRSRIELLPDSLDEDIQLNGLAYLNERRYNATDEVLRNDGASLALTSNIADGGFNTARAGFAFKRRDFFFPRDTSGELVRQERSEFVFEAGDDFFYPVIGKNLTATLSFGIAPRNVTRSVPGIDLASLSSQFLTGTTFLAPSASSMTASNISGSLEYLFASGLLKAEIRYEERSETNTLRFDKANALGPALSKKVADALTATSFETRSVVATFRARNDFSSSDALNMEFNARMYRYDTPSEENVDDRDEQYLYGIVRYSHAFNPMLKYLAEARVARGHLVYLESDRSAQNNATRSIALSNQVELATARVRNLISGEVFANYTEYDFILPSLTATGNFVIRGVSAMDSFFVSLGNAATRTRWGLAVHGEFRHSERGTFDPGAFAERPLLQTSELLAESLVHCTFEQTPAPVLLKFGARLFILYRRSALTNQTQPGLRDDERSARIGPMAVITLDRREQDGLRLYASLWYGFVNARRFADGTNTTGTQAEARLAAEWQF